MSKTCLVCKANGFTAIYNDTLLKCNFCGFVTANMEVDANILKQTYTENYFKGEEYVDYLRDKEILQTNFKKRLLTIFKRIDKSRITNIIEIGCAYGFFAETVTAELKNAKYTGYDVVPEAINYGRNELKQNIICGDYLEAITKEKVSDIFMWDVIEHLSNPEKFIEKASRELISGGRIYITTGDIECMVPRMQKAKWRMIHPPSHLQYFSKRTLSKLLENYGFKTVAVSYPPVYRSIRLIYYSLFMLRKKYPSFVEKVYNMIPAKMNIPFNTYDIMFLIAEKK
ncbi:MAG: class I SAM-dependent methyltransferase [Bacteroidota bacterium]